MKNRIISYLHKLIFGYDIKKYYYQWNSWLKINSCITELEREKWKLLNELEKIKKVIKEVTR